MMKIPQTHLAGASGMASQMLNIESVNKRYGTFKALDSVSFSVQKGSHVLVLGPNGAGKTTLIRCIMSLISFDGRVTVNGVDVKLRAEDAKAMIGYVPQYYAYYDNLSVYDHARLSSKLKGSRLSEVQEKLKIVDLWTVRQRKVKELSHGMRQRLGIGMALIGDPQLLLLDEPTSNVDLRGQLEFQQLLQQLIREGKTLLTTTHLTGFGELATQVVVLDKGKLIAEGTPAELLKKISMLDTIYLRVNAADAGKVAEMARTLGGTSTKIENDWVTFSVQITSKAGVLRGILNTNLAIDDVIVERTTIESEYLKLLGDGGVT